MMNIRVLLACSDINYIARLSEVLSKTPPDVGNVLEVTLFTNKEKLATALEGKKGRSRTRYHVALMDREMAEGFTNPGRIPAVLLLTDDESKNGITPEDELADEYIYKYQRISDIAKHLGKVFVSKHKGYDTKKGGAVCAFFSSAGGVGTSTVAASFAMAAAKAGVRPLYVSFEPFNSTEIFFTDVTPGRQGLKDVFAYKNDTGMSAAIDLIKSKDASGVSFLRKFSQWGELADVEPGDVERFIDAARYAEEIDLVILDLGCGGIGFTERALGSTDEAFIVTGPHDTALLKLKRLLDKDAFIYNECLDKTHLIYNRASVNDPAIDKDEDFGLRSVAYIPTVKGATPISVAASVTGHVSGLVNPDWKPSVTATLI